ncbi:MAG TPA: hypothetical protein VIR98_03055 [Candidatus Paceibacterota bacterium]|jgi:hypothetical protein
MRRIGNVQALIIIIIAMFFDALSLIPGISEYVAIAGQGILGVALYLCGVNVFKSKPAALYIISTIIEAIPGISVIPMFTIEAVALIVMSRRR